MGLLLGDVEYLENGNNIAKIWAAAPQSRSDRRKDRVETNPEQLAAASAEADRLSAVTGKTTRVIGWYHSHPHITVLPSHVDVKTQGMYQMLDQGFVGLIFSCFSEDSNKVGRIQAAAFQSSDLRKSRGTSPPNQWGQSSAPSQQGQGAIPFQSAEGQNVPGQQFSFNETSAAIPDGSLPMAMSNGSFATNVRESSSDSDVSGIQEAMLRSNMDQSGVFVRKEIPMRVLSSFSFQAPGLALAPLVSLQKILFDEERSAFHQALAQSDRDGKIHPLASMHHTATYQASLCKIMEYCLSPVLSSLWDRQHQDKLKLQLLENEYADLRARAALSSGVGESGVGSRLVGQRSLPAPGDSKHRQYGEDGHDRRTSSSNRPNSLTRQGSGQAGAIRRSTSRPEGSSRATAAQRDALHADSVKEHPSAEYTAPSPVPAASGSLGGAEAGTSLGRETTWSRHGKSREAPPGISEVLPEGQPKDERALTPQLHQELEHLSPADIVPRESR